MVYFSRTFGVACLAAMTMIGSGGAFATGTTSIYMVVKIPSKGYLYVYSLPTIKSAVVKKLRINDKVFIEDMSFGETCINGKTGEDYTGNIPSPNIWCQVSGLKMGNKSGWAYSRYLQFVKILQ